MKIKEIILENTGSFADLFYKNFKDVYDMYIKAGNRPERSMDQVKKHAKEALDRLNQEHDKAEK